MLLDGGADMEIKAKVNDFYVPLLQSSDIEF
jgi:hypothetical protein